MARGVNKVILIGNLGADPETKQLNSGKMVARFNMATSDGWKDKQTNVLQERTEWHRVTLFDRLAEIAMQYLRKGSKVYIEGRLRTSKWQDQEGKDRYMTEVVAREMQMLDGRGVADVIKKPLVDNTQTNYSVQPTGQFEASPVTSTAASSSLGSGTGENVFSELTDDDIPF